MRRRRPPHLVWILLLCSHGLTVASAAPHEGHEATGRILGTPDEQTGLGTLLTLGLIGASLALYSPAVRRRSSNRRSDDLSPAEEYAERIDEFEDKLTQNLGQSARQATRRVAHGVRGGLRRLGLLGRLGARAFTSVKSGVDTAARMAQYGIKAARRMARTGVARIGVGIARAGRASRNRLGRVGYALNSGFGRIGSAYSRGLRRVGTAARMGVDRMGTVASEGVSRIGEMASDSAQAVGGLATDLVDVAAVVPRGVMAAAKEKKVRDCLLQTLCYVSTPLVNPEAASRHRRLVRSLSGREVEESGSFRMEDCEVFHCEVVSLGRKAYQGLVSGNELQ